MAEVHLGETVKHINDSSRRLERHEAFKEAARLLRPHAPKLAAELENGCLRLQPGEPFFTVIGRDPTSAGVVRDWILKNRNVQPELKIEAAHEVADAMDRYPHKI